MDHVSGECSGFLLQTRSTPSRSHIDVRVAAPVTGIDANPDGSVEAGVRPVGDTSNQAVLQRIEIVDVMPVPGDRP